MKTRMTRTSEPSLYQPHLGFHRADIPIPQCKTSSSTHDSHVTSGECQCAIIKRLFGHGKHFARRQQLLFVCETKHRQESHCLLSNAVCMQNTRQSPVKTQSRAQDDGRQGTFCMPAEIMEMSSQRLTCRSAQDSSISGSWPARICRELLLCSLRQPLYEGYSSNSRFFVTFSKTNFFAFVVIHCYV